MTTIRGGSSVVQVTVLKMLLIALVWLSSAIEATPASGQVFQAIELASVNATNSTAGTDVYVTHAGQGTEQEGWPSMAQWVGFENMWRANRVLVQTGCSWFLGPGIPDNSESETDDLYRALLAVARATQVDARFVLAVLMQESRGCVRVTTTNSTHPNPGLMQSHNGTWTCVDIGSSPCSYDKIHGMISDGVGGTEWGDGLAAILNQQQSLGYSRSQLYYRAARVYNSGRVDSSSILENGGATHCYASSIANRLTGWARNQASYDCVWDTISVQV